MPTTLWFSLLGLGCAAAMAGYHGFYLATRYVLPEPGDREARGAGSVALEVLLAAAALGPLLRRVLPADRWRSGGEAASVLAFYVFVFAWLPLAKAAVVLARPRGDERERALAALYSVPLSLLYLAGIAYGFVAAVAMLMSS